MDLKLGDSVNPLSALRFEEISLAVLNIMSGLHNIT